MDRVQNPEDDDGTRRKIEGIILNNLYAVHSSLNPTIHYSKLKEATKAAEAFFDDAMINLQAGGWIRSNGVDEYIITLGGINEYNRRKDKGTLI